MILCEVYDFEPNQLSTLNQTQNVLIIDLTVDHLQHFQVLIHQIQLHTVVEEVWEFVMTEVKLCEFERRFSIFEPIITDHVSLCLINITVDQCQVSQLTQLRQSRVDQVKETQDGDRVRWQVESLQGADLGDRGEDEALRGCDQGALEGELHDRDTVETE